MKSLFFVIGVLTSNFSLADTPDLVIPDFIKIRLLEVKLDPSGATPDVSFQCRPLKGWNGVAVVEGNDAFFRYTIPSHSPLSQNASFTLHAQSGTSCSIAPLGIDSIGIESINKITGEAEFYTGQTMTADKMRTLAKDRPDILKRYESLLVNAKPTDVISFAYNKFLTCPPKIGPV